MKNRKLAVSVFYKKKIHFRHDLSYYFGQRCIYVTEAKIVFYIFCLFVCFRNGLTDLNAVFTDAL